MTAPVTQSPNTKFLGDTGPVVGLWPLALLTSLCALSLRQITDLDIFYHLANGRNIIDQGLLSSSNPYVWTDSGTPFYPNPAWLFGVGAAVVHGIVGLDGIIIFKTLLVLTLFALLYRYLREEMIGVRWASLLLWGVAMASAFRFTERPHLFSHLFLACFVWLVHRSRCDRGPSMYWLIPLTALWANFHAGFILGLGYLFLVLVAEVLVRRPFSKNVERWFEDRRLRMLGVTLLASTVASLFTPAPLASYQFLLQSLGAGDEFPITEYAAVSFSATPWFFPFAITLVLTALLKPRCRDLTAVLPAAVFLVAACLSVRFVPDFAIAALPLAAERIRVLTDKQSRHKHSVRWKWCADGLVPIAMVLLVFLFPPVGSTLGFGVKQGELPAGAFRFFAHHDIQGKLYNSMGFGGTGMYFLYPKYRLYQTSYFQVERERILEAYRANRSPESWREFLDRYQVEAVFVDTTREQHTMHFYPPPDWALVYFDDISAIYLRRWGINQQVIDQNEIRVAHPDRFFSEGGPDPVRENAEAAIIELNRLLSLEDNSFLVHFMLGCYLLHKEQGGDEASTHLNRALELNPESAAALFQRGLFRRKQGDLEGSARDFARAAELVPGDAQAWNELGVTRGMQRRYSEAMQSFRRSIEADPGYVEAAKNLEHARLLQAGSE